MHLARSTAAAPDDWASSAFRKALLESSCMLANTAGPRSAAKEVLAEPPGGSVVKRLELALLFV